MTDTCLNCGAPLGGAFCSACGQKRAAPLATPRVLREGLGKLLDADNAWWTTLRELSLRPGPTVRRYVAGERKRFVNPLLYLLTMATVMLLVTTALGVDIANVQAVAEENRGRFALVFRSIGYLALLGALPVAWAMRLVLRGKHTVGELYVLLLYSYAQLVLLQALMYALGAAATPATFIGSRLISALVFCWSFAGYFGWGPLRALFAGLLGYVALLAMLMTLGWCLIAASILWSRFVG